MDPHRFISQKDPEHSILEIDSQQEVIRILSSNGSPIGTLSWDTLIHVIEDSPPQNNQRTRTKARAPLAMRVQYRNTTDKKMNGMTGGVGAGGLFIETRSPYPVHTDLTVTFTLPTQPESPITAKATVTWTRGMTERLVRMPGMGIEFTEIDNAARIALTQLIHKNRETQQDELTSDIGSDTQA